MIKSKCFTRDFEENNLDLSTKSIIIPKQEQNEQNGPCLYKDNYLSEFETDLDKQKARDNINAQEKGDYVSQDTLSSKLYQISAVIIKWMYNDAALIVETESISSDQGEIIYNVATNQILYRIKETKKIYKYWDSKVYPKPAYCHPDNTPYQTKRYVYSNTFYTYDDMQNILARNKEILEWSGIIVKNVPVSDFMAMDESDPNNIYFDDIKQSFLYKKQDGSYCSLWKTSYKYQRHPYEEQYFSAGFNLNAIFVGIKGPTLIAYDESKCSLIGSAVITDSEFSLTSDNPIQNKVITDLLIKMIRWTDVN